MGEIKHTHIFLYRSCGSKQPSLVIRNIHHLTQPQINSFLYTYLLFQINVIGFKCLSRYTQQLQ